MQSSMADMRLMVGTVGLFFDGCEHAYLKYLEPGDEERDDEKDS
jgi:hypothetical protein